MAAPPGGYRLKLAPVAMERRALLARSNPQRLKKVDKALRFLKENPAHPSLNAHKWDALKGKAPDGGDMWVAYVENRTPSAWRIFFCYDKNDPGAIHVAAIEPHS